MDIFTASGLIVLGKVIMIDLVLAGDNAVVIGLAAAGLPPKERARAIMAGVVGATVLRIFFAAIAIYLLQIVGLILIGGFLLLWVCWKMWRELRGSAAHAAAAQEALADADLNRDGVVAGGAPKKTFRQAAMQIIVADVSMSLDNVLAVAGAAREHPVIMAIGLIFSIALIGLAASLIARLLERFRWIAYLGLAIVLYVALEMIWRGAEELWPHAVALM